MAIHRNRFGVKGQTAALGMVLGLVFAATVRGDDTTRKALFAKVNPSVVQVRQENGSLGSGFVVAVDGDSAIVSTNYHVVEGAKKITIFFPADDREMKNGLEADGYIDIQTIRDLALVHFNLKGKKVAPLKIADNPPEQGDTVYTFGSPVGQRNTIAVGMVSCVRSGKEVADLMDRLGKGAYEKGMGYTTDATWIQHTAPMSHGNSGGPLVNDKGQVVGLNTMNFAQRHAAGRANVELCNLRHSCQEAVERRRQERQTVVTLPPPARSMLGRRIRSAIR